MQVLNREAPTAYRTADAQREFDRWSRSYDRTLLQRLFFQPSHDLLLEMLGPADERILDIGCGTCRFATRVLERYPRSQVWGLDLSEGMLGQSQARCPDSGSRLHLVRGDSERLPFADGTFDVVTCTHSFHHYPRQDQVVAEMHRVLRPGGRLLLIDGDRDGLWGRLVFDVLVVLMEGPVRHLSGLAMYDLFWRSGFEAVSQRRRGGPLPFFLTLGRAVKPAGVTVAARQVA
jgi:ubiquinone/menaquinone biosynthesis C-methylase UbiE